MRLWIGCTQLAFMALVLLGCDRQQEWTFHNGVDLGDIAPTELLVEVYDSPECGFGCEPPGNRVYCEVLSEGEQGAAPQNLIGSRSYCFMGTAIDESGIAYAIGCTVADVGGEPIDIPLSRLEASVAITRRCTQPMVMFDAGVGMDAGPPHRDAGPIDAGPAPVDAGPPRVDAGSGLPFGSPIRVTFTVSGNGTLRMTGSGLNDIIDDRTTFFLDAYVGYALRLDAQALAGSSFVTFSGGCGTTNPCDITLDRPETIDAAFSTP